MKKTVYRCNMFSVEEERIRKPRDILIKRVRSRDAVIVLPFIGRNRLLVGRQYRYAIKKTIYGFPSGYIEPGEAPVHAARRELEEETGYRAEKMRFLFKAYFCPGTYTSVAYYFAATGLVRKRPHREKDEVIRMVQMRVGRLLAALDEDNTKDNATIAGLMYYMRSKRRKAQS